MGQTGNGGHQPQARGRAANSADSDLSARRKRPRFSRRLKLQELIPRSRDKNEAFAAHDLLSVLSLNLSHHGRVRARMEGTMKRVSLGWLLVITCLNPTRLVASPPPANQLEEIRRILRQASQLIESIPERDQPSAASNIANTQARAGDLSGALATAHQLKTAEALAQTLGSIAYAVDYAGNVDGALSLIKDSVDGQAKNSSYEMVAEAHANKGDFSGALKIAHLIEHEPSRLQEA